MGFAVLVSLPPGTAWGQEEVTSNIYRLRAHETSTGYYEDYEATPLPYGPSLRGQILGGGAVGTSPTAESVRRRNYLADSHRGLRFYNRLTCVKCHPREAHSIHTDRIGITCRQCHGPEPIAGINHYYSSMSPTRRHAYVCSKCHEGANASFATYLVHEPVAGSLITMRIFPAFFFSYWFMLLLLLGTMAFFLPHILMIALQEASMKKGKVGIDLLAFFIPQRFMLRLREIVMKRTEPVVEILAFFEQKDLMEALQGLFQKKEKPGK